MDELRNNLFYEQKNGYDLIDTEERIAVEDYCKGYMEYLNDSRTEREAVSNAIAMAEELGFVAFKPGMEVKPGMKFYCNNRGKALMLAVIGKKSLAEGCVIAGAHVDAPRLDLKQVTMYESDEMCYFKTHYYGGIKKYQWTTIPLAIHGVVFTKDGKKHEIIVGEKDDDPVFGVSDLLIHLSAAQLEKKGARVVEGEDLNVLVGSMPLKVSENDDDKAKEAKQKVAAGVLKILKDTYDVEEEDFLSAEIEVVPAGPARDYGFDRSMIMGYGHDDRVCAYPSFMAMLDMDVPERTSVCLLVDKEEIGSVGATGMQSKFFENTTAEVMNATGDYSELKLRRCLTRSRVLSSDVSAAYDPNYPAVFEKKNSAYFGRGLVFNKYTGARGKSGSNDAGAEYVADIRRIMDDNNVSFQTAELGKVDAGGGGTIAYILGNYDMEVIDSGVAVLNMHAPWEIISKADLYEAYKGYIAFLKNA